MFRPEFYRKIILLSGFSCLVLAATVIYGWLTVNMPLLQINQNFAPMQFNTAIGFLFSGLAMVCLYRDKFECAQILGGFAFLIGFASLSQYMFQVDLNIDNLFVDHTITTKTSHPGRMAPNTAICFILTGLALFIHQFSRRIFGAVAIAVFFLASLSLVGYLFHTESIYGWGNLTRMAIHTAGGFLVLGSGLVAKVFLRSENIKFDIWSFTPLTLSLLIVLMTFFFWQTLQDLNKARTQTYFKELVEDTQDTLLARYNLYEQSLRSGLALYYASESVERHEWADFVRALKIDDNLPGINGVGYIDYVATEDLDTYLDVSRLDDAPEFTNHPETEFSDKFIIKFIEPVYRNQQAVGLDIGFEANRREAAERARDTGLPSLTKKIQLVQDNKKEPGFLLLIPVYETEETPDSIEDRQRNLSGWIYAPFMGSNFLTGLTRTVGEQLEFYVYDGNNADEENFIFKSTPEIERTPLRAQTSITIAGRPWTIIWTSSNNFRAPTDNNAAVILSVFGIIFALLIYFAFSRIVHSRSVIAREVRKQTAALKKSKFELEKSNTELERSNKELERFAYIASHDLQEPLRKIGGFTDRLNQKLSDSLDEQSLVYMNFVLDGVERMRELTQGLLAYSRISTEKIDIEKLDANEILALAKDNLSETIRDTNAEITCSDLPEVYYDKVMLTQLFQNLIGNAIKYKSDAPPQINITVQEKGNEWEFAVQDNGMGMEERYLERIFTMFQRLHRKEDIPGTGIGLSLCQKIVERYGGKIYATSALGKGSTFYFTIPKK